MSIRNQTFVAEIPPAGVAARLDGQSPVESRCLLAETNNNSAPWRATWVGAVVAATVGTVEQSRRASSTTTAPDPTFERQTGVGGRTAGQAYTGQWCVDRYL